MQTLPTPIKIQLSDGTAVTLRPWESTDQHRLPETLRHVTSSNGVLKYFAPVSPALNEDPATQPAVKNPRLVWVAVAPGQEQLLGLARLAPFENKPWLAEIALGVEPSVQQRGLGRRLLAALYAVAEADGIRSLYALVPEENQPVIAWGKRLGATAKLYVDEVVELNLPVCQDAALMPQNESSRRFQDVLKERNNPATRASVRSNIKPRQPQKTRKELVGK